MFNPWLLYKWCVFVFEATSFNEEFGECDDEGAEEENSKLATKVDDDKKDKKKKKRKRKKWVHHLNK